MAGSWCGLGVGWVEISLKAVGFVLITVLGFASIKDQTVIIHILPVMSIKKPIYLLVAYPAWVLRVSTRLQPQPTPSCRGLFISRNSFWGHCDWWVLYIYIPNTGCHRNTGTFSSSLGRALLHHWWKEADHSQKMGIRLECGKTFYGQNVMFPCLSRTI